MIEKLNFKADPMKRVFLLILFLSVFYSIHSQKHDNNWIFSQVRSSSQFHQGPPFGSSFLNFGDSLNHFHQNSSPINVGAGGIAMSDSLGNVLFYTNGYKVIDRNDNVMPNGEDLTPTGIRNEIWGYTPPQSVTCLRDGKEKEIYHLYIQDWDLHDTLGAAIYSVLRTTIDMRMNNGYGDVVEKNIPIFGNKAIQSDSLFGNFAMTKHGNGRDWWCAMPSLIKNLLYKFIITPDGVISRGSQTLEFLPEDGTLSNGQNKFSPNGKLYALKELDSQKIYVYSFERCSGLMSEFVTIDMGVSNSPALALEFSPNSRFLYYSDANHVIQADLESNLIQENLDTIGIRDGYLSPFGNSFWKMQITPNNKIVIVSGNDVNNMDVINAPNEKGIDCEFIPHGIQTLNFRIDHIPYHPNYRLYDFKDSPCDTLGIDR